MLRNIIEINEELCTGCGLCILDCAEGALRIENGKAKVIGEHLCDGLGNCLKGCPTGALKIVQREAAPFDEEAVRKLQQQHGGVPLADTVSLPRGNPMGAGGLPPVREGFCGISEQMPQRQAEWPLKLRLINTLPQNADILLCADCAAPLIDNFKGRYAENRRVITVCPKFENVTELAERLGALLGASSPKSLTSLRVQVPCCQGTAMLAEKSLRASGIKLQALHVVVDFEGKELQR